MPSFPGGAHKSLETFIVSRSVGARKLSVLLLVASGVTLGHDLAHAAPQYRFKAFFVRLPSEINYIYFDIPLEFITESK